MGNTQALDTEPQTGTVSPKRLTLGEASGVFTVAKQDDAREAQPAAKKARASPTAEHNNKVVRCEFVTKPSIMEGMLPKLREDRHTRRGTRLNPEPPRLVAKVCEEKGKGELWLGPLPTVLNMESDRI